jgi:hypothetical protein
MCPTVCFEKRRLGFAATAAALSSATATALAAAAASLSAAFTFVSARADGSDSGLFFERRKHCGHCAAHQSRCRTGQHTAHNAFRGLLTAAAALLRTLRAALLAGTLLAAAAFFTCAFFAPSASKG